MALNSQLLTVQILTNDGQVFILCLSYFITTVTPLLPWHFSLHLLRIVLFITLFYVCNPFLLIFKVLKDLGCAFQAENFQACFIEKLCKPLF